MFADLPTEIISNIAYHVEFFQDLNALALTNRRFAEIAGECLYRRDVGELDASSLKWAIFENEPDTIKRAVAFGIDINSPVLIDSVDYEKRNLDRWTKLTVFWIRPLALAMLIQNDEMIKLISELGGITLLTELDLAGRLSE